MARLTALACLLAAGCGDDASDGDGNDNGGENNSGNTGDGQGDDAKYVVAGVVTTMGTPTGYVTVLDSLNPSKDEVSIEAANEFPGSADMWVHDGSVFVSGGDAPTVKKFSVSAKGELKKQGEINFMRSGAKTTAFWANVFLSPTKAYMGVSETEFIIWNPKEMKIEGELTLDALEERDGFVARLGSTDRSAIVHEDRLFLPAYWTDADYADRPADSRILVFDITKDKVVDVLEAPCPGLDVGTIDEDGNMYFSPWTGGAGTKLVLDTAATCVVKVVADTLEVSKAFDFADVTDGREGAAFNYAGDGRFVMSIFHHENIDNLEDVKDPWEPIGTENWKVWTYDPKTNKAQELDSIPGSSGAIYWFRFDGKAHGLIPAANYAAASAFELGTDEDDAKELFDVQGWAVRLFRVR
jgi:hypothetical protein